MHGPDAVRPRTCAQQIGSPTGCRVPHCCARPARRLGRAAAAEVRPRSGWRGGRGARSAAAGWELGGWRGWRGRDEWVLLRFDLLLASGRLPGRAGAAITAPPGQVAEWL